MAGPELRNLSSACQKQKTKFNKAFNFNIFRGEIITSQVPENIRWEVVQILNRKMEEQKLVDSSFGNNLNLESQPEDYQQTNIEFDSQIDSSKFVKSEGTSEFAMAMGSKDQNLSNVKLGDKVLSRQKRQFPVFGFLSFLRFLGFQCV